VGLYHSVEDLDKDLSGGLSSIERKRMRRSTTVRQRTREGPSSMAAPVAGAVTS